MSSRFQSQWYVEKPSTERTRVTSVDFLGDDDYDQLPEPLKQVYSRREYLWLSDHEKSVCVRRECEPDWIE